MIIDGEGYIELIHFLTDNLSVFEEKAAGSGELTISDQVTEHIAESVILVCSQHPKLTSNQRFEVVRETDAIVNDLEEVLSTAWHKYPSPQQAEFIEEFVGLIKNLFDSEISNL